jgi:hypothetical protein
MVTRIFCWHDRVGRDEGSTYDSGVARFILHELPPLRGAGYLSLRKIPPSARGVSGRTGKDYSTGSPRYLNYGLGERASASSRNKGLRRKSVSRSPKEKERGYFSKHEGVRDCGLQSREGLSKGRRVPHAGLQKRRALHGRRGRVSAVEHLEGVSHEPPEFENLLVHPVRQSQDLPAPAPEGRALLCKPVFF